MGKIGAILSLLGVVIAWGLSLPTSFSADFVEKVITPQNRVLIYRGKVYYQRERAYWHYTYPTEKKIWITPLGYISYEPDLMQVTISQKPLNLNLQQILDRAKKVGPHTYIAVVKGRRVQFHYDHYLRDLNYTDELENRVEFNFTNPSTAPLPPTLFRPKYPADVDKIYQ